ncbi:hypothetical protein PTKIN_Ptkin01aG0322100 [Pterospermum kingtungense]
MASPMRSQKIKSENYNPTCMNSQQPVLDVAPLNCVPYIGPNNPDDMFSSPPKVKAEAVRTEAGENIGPAMIFLPSHSTREELDNIMAASKTGVALTGAATTGKGPAVGAVDIGELEDSYYFRVTLPGVSSDKRHYSCDIEPDGKILIKGISTTGEKIVCRNFQIFHMLTQNLCPPGEFTVSFNLPGPVNHLEVTSHLADGILEAVVKKR